jgi:hypothetical protein
LGVLVKRTLASLFLVLPQLLLADVTEVWKIPSFIQADYVTQGGRRTQLVIKNTKTGKELIWNDPEFRTANGKFIILTDSKGISRAYDHELNQLAAVRGTYIRRDTLYMAHVGAGEAFGYIRVGDIIEQRQSNCAVGRHRSGFIWLEPAPFFPH